MRSFIFFISCLSFSSGFTQVFEPTEVQGLVKKATNHIYNAQQDSSMLYIEQVEQLIPQHPVVPLLKAMTQLWVHIPTLSDEVFTEMEANLRLAISQAQKHDPDNTNPEMMFFAMAARGILAEYYADQDQYLKAVSEANRAYSILKDGFDLVDENPEFLLTTGLYNYFRERYPEKHPVYKPFLWFLRSGDKELGLRQLQRACDSFLTKVEAHIYLSYIYLRYEDKPEKAQKYLQRLCSLYPSNYYVKAKYLESMANPVDFQAVEMDLLNSLTDHPNPYYKLAGSVFKGYYCEVVKHDTLEAENQYRIGLSYGDALPRNGEYFKGFGYLGLARILLASKVYDPEEVNSLIDLALEFAETEQIKDDAQQLKKRL